MDATTVAIDLAKDVFQVAVANRAGRVLDRQRFTRRQFERFVETLAVDTDVIMESCGTSHYWGRRLQARGLRVQLLPVQYVRPYVRRNKTAPTPTPSSKPLAAARFAQCQSRPSSSKRSWPSIACGRNGRRLVWRGLMRSEGCT